MEFPDLGEHCSYQYCEQLDFLPIKCQCTKTFCRVHFLEHYLSGDCPCYVDAKQDSIPNSDSTIYKCETKKCGSSSYIRMPCEKCDKHFCISHRFHLSCHDQIPETVILENERIQQEDAKNEKTRQMIEAEVTLRLRNAEQTSKAKTALKIQLMKLKSKAIGEKTIPPADRIYFALRKPSDDPTNISQEASREITIANPTINDSMVIPVYVSRQWSLGRIVDSLANLCKVNNCNNIKDAKKLRLFRESDGMCLALRELNMVLSNLMHDKILIDGERLLFAYISADDIKTSNENSVYFLK